MHTTLMKTTRLAQMMFSGDDESLEAAIEAQGAIKITSRMSSRIEEVCGWAFDTDHPHVETLCQLAQRGHARSAKLILAKWARIA